MAAVVREFRKCMRNILNTTLLRSNIHSKVVNPPDVSKGTDDDDDEREYKYELSFNKDEWEYVERLIPLKLVPNVTKKSEYPSGWRPQTEEAMKHPYYISRSKNHMLPVYLVITDRGRKKSTVVKHVFGDLWKLHEELHKHLEETLKRPISTTVLEGNRSFKFSGDHVYYCQQFLLEKGF